MALVTGTVEAAHSKWDKWNILVNDKWYSTKLEYARAKPGKGAVVEFDDGGAKFTKNLRVISEGEPYPSGGYPSPSPKSGTKTYSNLGVELGHASNVAKDMAIHYSLHVDIEIGSPEWYKYWVTHTEKVYNVMKALRYKYEIPPPIVNDSSTDSETAPVVMTNGSKEEPDSEPSLDDLF
jgi:hypothetical protein